MDESATDSSAPVDPNGLDLIRIERADGTILEYRVRGLRLEQTGIPAASPAPGEPERALRLEADAVLEHRRLDRAEHPPSPFDHVSLRVRDLEACKAFYCAALEPLGLQPLYEGPGCVGMGFHPGERAPFWLGSDETSPTSSLHLCFQAASRQAVDDFHAASLSGGGRCNGLPGIRPEYHPGYYAAFVLDPEGNNVEAVFRDPGAN